ncbi:hypothetical protein [Pectinatus frisingensis]|uniref:hypothetical protein n=1 Tax=Pectinatus frisingensis TaxID=865 RepID=UPI0018C6903C|nr:hypothetical protein [Pectinatus frisingensis]
MEAKITGTTKEIAELLLRIESRPVPASDKELSKIFMNAISIHSNGSALREALQSAAK